MQKQIPILYSTPMAAAKVAGIKKQTRRILKVKGCKPFIPHEGYSLSSILKWNENYHPYGQSGDILWGRESWAIPVDSEGNDVGYQYKADYDGSEWWPWKPSIHMPKSAARIWDEIIDIRVERVGSISESDAIAEGIESLGDGYWRNYEFPNSDWNDPIGSFRSLWQSINGKPRPIVKRMNGIAKITDYVVFPFDNYAAAEFKDTWNGKPLTVYANPWVWVIETKSIQNPNL